ncbi:MAG TPA: N-acetylmuramoyl-L-alanine amidase [Sphingobacterium sp.]|nr:N-acetylmuramoyl-L-alanine amidase [Sphingobacterium sp.]
MKSDLRIRKWCSVVSATLGFFLLNSFTLNNGQAVPPDYQIKTIVIDAGHGGKDTGAQGRRSLEKNVALEVALKLGKQIQKDIPGIKIIYTRTTDEFVELYKRIRLANANKADLFISIHCNSSGASAHGTETLVSGSHRLGQQDAAVRENASLLLESNYKENYQGFDPKDPESAIIFSLMKNRFREKSIRLAQMIEGEYVKAGRYSRGFWEKGLAVLAEAGMPDVLTEIGFISNREEESYLLSDEGKQEIVNNLVSALKIYKNSVER